MMKLRLVVALAASAALTPMAAAQTVSDPDPFSAPSVSVGAGAAVAAPRAAPPHAVPMARSPQAAPHGHWGVRGAGPRPPAAHPRAMRPPIVTPAPMTREIRREFRHRGPVQGHHFGFRRVHRGGFVPQFWWGPQFIVRNWSHHGFPQPFHGGRWIRYYDDALLIDRYGRVHDARSDWEWDRYGDRWDRDENGVPVYVGDGDFEPERWDYEWAEGWDRGEYREDYAEDRGPPPPPMPAPGYGVYGHGGYGYGYAPCACGPVVVTETIVTTPAVVEQVTYYETIEERTSRPAVKVRSKRVKAHRVPAVPHDGERG
jgi:Ni/Co efflux regulator RcnB